MHQHIELFRQKGLASFRELLVAVTKDPAMLVWLDGRVNRKGKPNENYAREIMELFTLGVGNYTEHDIKQLARAFTGWEIRDAGSSMMMSAAAPGTMTGVLNEKQFDDGEKEIFGVKSNFNAQTAIDLILKQPAAPKFLAKKMIKEFVHPQPTDEQIEHYASRLLAADWDVKTVLREMISSRMFFSDWAYRSKIKSPVELAIGAALVVGGKVNAQYLREEMAKMGQNLLYPPNVKGWDGEQAWINSNTVLVYPPNVKGWDGEQAWINSNTVLVRFNLGLMLATQRRDDLFARRTDYESFLRQHQAKTAAEVLDVYAKLMFDGRLDDEKRAELLEYMNRNEKNEPAAFVLNGGTVNSKVRGVLHLLMSTPEYQLA
jgi:uncharacterized protein (DUF1800 family)